MLVESSNNLLDVLISDLATRGRRLLPPDSHPPASADQGGPIPALSAFASTESKQKASLFGFQRYSTKPFEPNTIVDEILALRAQNGADFRR